MNADFAAHHDNVTGLPRFAMNKKSTDWTCKNDSLSILHYWNDGVVASR